MSKINAEKDGSKRTFSKIAWDLLGAEKGGWIQIPSEITKKDLKNSKKDDKVEDNPIGKSIKTSKDFTVDKAILKLKEFKTVKELNDFSKDENRPALIAIIEKIRENIISIKKTKKVTKKEE